ncbi:MAG: hypothetical protein RLZ97_2449 [Verrucomicrobiota bacterium]|jgi:hypothetical protein
MAHGAGEATTILVTPVWNDSRRLAGYGPELAAVLARHEAAVRWIIADDGSEADELPRLSALREGFASVFPRIELHPAALHRGKGGVIIEAWEAAPDADWYAFVDADGSIAASEMLRLIERAWKSGRTTIGVRKTTTTTRVEERWWRGLRHRGFLLACRLLLGLDTDDTQCGAKVIRGDDFRRIRGRLREVGFAFDAEILGVMNAEGIEWDEVPVNWVEKGESRLRPADSWKMLKALWRIRARL